MARKKRQVQFTFYLRHLYFSQFSKKIFLHDAVIISNPSKNWIQQDVCKKPGVSHEAYDEVR